jgi:hypothetical protein
VSMMPTYEPSGSSGALTPVSTFVILALSAGGAWLYQFLMDLIPYLILIWLLLMGYAVLLGGMCMTALKAAKVRAVPVGALAGVLGGAAAVLASNYFAYIRATDGSIAFSEYITQRADTGWTVGQGGSGMPLTGALAWIIWGLEALALLMAGLLGGVAAAKFPFCEQCGRYAKRQEGVVTIKSPAPAMVEMVRKATTVREVVSAQGGGGGQHDRLEYEVRGCPTCDRFSTVTVKFKTKVSTKRSAADKSEDLHRNVLLTDAEAKTLKGGVTPKA